MAWSFFSALLVASAEEPADGPGIMVLRVLRHKSAELQSVTIEFKEIAAERVYINLEWHASSQTLHGRTQNRWVSCDFQAASAETLRGRSKNSGVRSELVTALIKGIAAEGVYINME